MPRLTCAGPRQAERDDLTQTGGDGAGQKKYKKTKNDRGDEKRRLNVVCTPVPIPIMIIPAHQALTVRQQQSLARPGSS